ncbi:hypothetical protein ACFE04_028988 [Oxalis oulophora]
MDSSSSKVDASKCEEVNSNIRGKKGNPSANIENSNLARDISPDRSRVIGEDGDGRLIENKDSLFLGDPQEGKNKRKVANEVVEKCNRPVEKRLACGAVG